MAITRPTTAQADTRNKTVTLFNGDESLGEFYMRGGICWPISYQKSDGSSDIEGFALMAGQDIKTGIVTVFEEEPFVAVDHITRDGKIEFKGLSQWFNRVWAHYAARDYYWHQDQETNKKFLLQVLRSKMIEPKPQFILAPWKETGQVLHTIWERIKLKTMRIEKDGHVHRALEFARKSEKDIHPVVHALACCLGGIERYPWRKKI